MRPIPQAAIDFIKKREALRLSPYFDSAGLPTIGWGHLLSPVPRAPLSAWKPITAAQAEALLAADLGRTARLVCGAVEVPLNDNEYAALLSLAFNVPLTMKSSTLLTMLNAGDRAGASKQFVRWDKEHRGGVLVESAGLKVRRLDEAALFVKAAAVALG